MIFLSALAVATVIARPPDWDWTGIIGTGQSLATGGFGFPIRSKSQPFNNLKLDTDGIQWPIDPNDPRITVVPLTEPVGRHPTGYPSSWPTNIDGETPHTSAANEISYLVQQALHREYVTVHVDVAEAGQGMIRIQKNSVREGVSGRAYEASMVAARAIKRLATQSGKTFGVGAIFMTHGETDTGNAKYEEQLRQLWSDYNSDLRAITGQKRDVQMIVSQQNRLGDYSPATIAQWKVGVDYPKDIVCSGPKYQYRYTDVDQLHMVADSYRQLGEKYGEVYFERVVLGHNWRPLEPLSARRTGAAVTIMFHVPIKPLVWDSTLGQPHPSSPEWANGKGFEIADQSGKRVTIVSAEIRDGDTVVLKLNQDPGPGARLSYALVGEPALRNPRYGATPHWGLLRDSDPFVGYNTKLAQPNYCVAFELKLP
ncbi:MAG: dockerin [Fimbriimonadaceae bacterium]